MKKGFLKAKLDGNRCDCKGCEGNDRKNAPAHKGQCGNNRQNASKYGPYCARCYRNHLCVRCMATKNATRDSPKDAHAYDLSICKDTKPEEQHCKTVSKKCFKFTIGRPKSSEEFKEIRRPSLGGKVPFRFCPPLTKIHLDVQIICCSLLFQPQSVPLKRVSHVSCLSDWRHWRH